MNPLPPKPSSSSANLAGFLAFLAVFFYVLRPQPERYGGGPLDYLLSPAFFWVLGLGAAAYALREWYRGSVQSFLNKLADTLLESPKSAPYWLYLRPFSLDGAMPQKNPGYHGIFGIFSFNQQRRDFEELLRLAVQKTGNLALVALGSRKVLQGAGRVETPDREWQENLQSLAQSARWILVIPGGGAVCWEVEFIVGNELLARTIFVMPPVSVDVPTLRIKPKTELERAREYWVEAVQKMKSLGLEMPAYRKGGMFFTLDRDGQPERQAVLKSNNPQVLRKALRWITDDPHV